MAVSNVSKFFNEDYFFDDQNLLYDRDDNTFIWEKTFEELKDFLDQVLQSQDDAEINVDRTHNAYSYKKADLTVRFYSTTKKLKFYGSTGPLLIDEFHKKLGTFSEISQSTDSPSFDPPTFNSAMASNSPTAHGQLLFGSLSPLLDQLDFLIKEVAFLKSVILNGAEKDPEILGLKDEINIQKEEIKMQKENVLTLQREKDALVRTIAILMSNKDSNCPGMDSVTDVTKPSLEVSISDVSNKKKKNKKRNKKKKSVPAAQTTGSSSNNTTSKTSSESQSNSNSSKTSSSEVSTSTTARPPPSNRTIIVGDSILSKLEGWKMSYKNNRVIINDFPGSTVDDLKDHIKPIVRREPDRIIIHIGTNNLRQDKPQEIVNKIKDVCDYIEENSNCSFAISELTVRSDSSELETARKKVNQLLHQSFDDVISHSTVTERGLNSKGLHLNRSGLSALAKDFNNYIHSKNDI